jgi:hypothetical protein
MKKLTLNRETLSVLSTMQEQQINGGISVATQCHSKDLKCVTDSCNYCETDLLCVTVPCPNPTFLCYTPQCGAL